MLSGPRKWVTSNVDGRMRSWAIVVASVNLPPSHCRACVISPSVDVRCKQGLPKGSSIITLTQSISALAAPEGVRSGHGRRSTSASRASSTRRVEEFIVWLVEQRKPTVSCVPAPRQRDFWHVSMSVAAGSKRPGFGPWVGLARGGPESTSVSGRKWRPPGRDAGTPPQSLRRLGLCSICPAQLGTPCPY